MDNIDLCQESLSMTETALLKVHRLIQNEDKVDLKNRFNLMCHKHQCLYQCDCSSIDVVHSVKYLGIYIDQHLKWDHHVDFLSKKLRKINYSLYYMRDFLRSDHLKQLYLSWFVSTMRYGIVHYGGAYISVLRPIVMCQRNAVRTIYRIRKMDRV